VNYLVEEVIRHPQYKPPAKYNDVALLKLDHAVEFNESIRPACLHTTDAFPINKTVATGWGRIDYGTRILCSVAGKTKCGPFGNEPTRLGSGRTVDFCDSSHEGWAYECKEGTDIIERTLSCEAAFSGMVPTDAWPRTHITKPPFPTNQGNLTDGVRCTRNRRKVL
jgi:hypothetical protein